MTPLAAIAVSLCGCGDRPVVSTYKPVPKVPDAVIVLPDIQFTGQTYSGSESYSIPFGKSVEFRGRVFGADRLPKSRRISFVTLRPKGVNENRGRAIIKFGEPPSKVNSLEFTAMLDPLKSAGERDLLIEVDGQTIARFSAVVVP